MAVYGEKFSTSLCKSRDWELWEHVIRADGVENREFNVFPINLPESHMELNIESKSKKKSLENILKAFLISLI